MVKFIDFLIEEPFDLAFRNIDTYTKRFFDQFIKEEHIVGDNLRIDFNELNVEKSVYNIKEQMEKIAKDHGIKRNIQKRINTLNYITMGVFFIPLLNSAEKQFKTN